MSRQTKYKETRLPWCSQIPYDWEVKQLKYCFQFTTGFTPPTKDENLFNGDNIWVTIGDMSERYISDSKTRITDEAIKKYNGTLVKSGSLLFSFKLSVGKVAFATKDIYTNEAIIAIPPVENLNLNFFYYTLPFQLLQNANENIYGAKILNQDLIKNAYLVVPPLTQQNIISKFLDERTTEIDKLISQKLKLIDCLKDERVGVITRAVTKGIQNDVSTKKANNEWLGVIPEKWSEKKLKFLTSYFKGFAFKSADFFEAGVPIIKATNIKNWQIENVKEFIEIENQREEFEKVRLKKGVIIISTVGSKPDVVNSAVGQIAIISEEFTNAYLNQNTVCIRPTNKIDAGYLKYSMLSNYFRSNLNAECAWIANQAYLEVEDILNISIPVPPTVDEQIVIANYINDRLQIIAQSISKIEQEIELIKEYRTSLINEVVTGKIRLN